MTSSVTYGGNGAAPGVTLAVMSTFAGWLHVPDLKAGDSPDSWRVVCRDGAAQAQARRAVSGSAVTVEFRGERAVRREARSYRPDGSILRGDDGKPMDAGVSNLGWHVQPLTVFSFSLADAPELGVFAHVSTAWATVDSAIRSGLLDRLAGEEAVAMRLTVERQRYTAKNGSARGTLVDYTYAALALC